MLPILRSLVIGLLVTLASPTPGHAIVPNSRGYLAQQVFVLLPGAPAAQAIPCGHCGVPHGGHGAPVVLRRPKAPHLRPPDKIQLPSDQKAPKIIAPQGPVRHNLGLPSASWVRFFIPLVLLVWLASTARTVGAGWPVQ